MTSLWTYDWWPVSQTMASRGRVEHPVQGQGELDRPEVRPEVAAVHGDRVDQHVPDLRRKLLQLVSIEML